MSSAFDEALAEVAPEGGEDELWLVSYADLLTLLIAFFVLLVAAAPLQQSRFTELASSLEGAASPLGEFERDVETMAARDGLVGRMRPVRDGHGVGVELSDGLLFASGSAAVSEEGRLLLEEVAELVRARDGLNVVIEGHTDDLPIRSDAFRSNWELSTSRALGVLTVLERAGLPAERLSVRGYADTRPARLDGTLDERRAANRRVVIRLE